MRQLALIALLLGAVTVDAETNSDEYTDRWQSYAHELLRDSIAFPSVRGLRQVAPFAEYLANEFARHGFAAEDELSHSSNEKLPVGEFFAALDHWYSVIRDLAAL